MVRIFFSKNKKSAQERINRLAKNDKSFRNQRVVLAKRQVPHISKWRTFQLKKRRKK